MPYTSGGPRREVQHRMQHGGLFTILTMGRIVLPDLGFLKMRTVTLPVLLLLFGTIVRLTPSARAETTKTIFNPFTGKLDFITALSSTTLTTAGAALACPSNANGLLLTDSASCTWCETVATTGNLVTTLINCPTVAQVRGCTTGVPYGILLSVTCP
jgi:hypothetical protein